MPDPQPGLEPQPDIAASTFTEPSIFAWHGGEIVLLGERSAERWIVARSWRQADRLSDVRRWSFADPRAFAGQIRRLARDATGDPSAGRLAGIAAAAWAEAQGTAGCG